MVRSCVDRWLVVYVAKLVKMHGMGAFEILFGTKQRIELGYLVKSGDCLFDAITGSLKVDKPDLHRNIKARVFAVTKYNGNSNEVEAVLSM